MARKLLLVSLASARVALACCLQGVGEAELGRRGVSVDRKKGKGEVKGKGRTDEGVSDRNDGRRSE